MSERSRSQGSGVTTWYSNYDFTPSRFPSNWPPQLLPFSDKELERLIFRYGPQPLSLTSNRSGLSRQKERVEWLGVGILTALASDYLFKVFPDQNEVDLMVRVFT